MAWRSRKTGFACGDGRFTNQLFPFIKVSFLFVDVHDDLGRTRSALVIPPARRSGARVKTWLVRRILLATANNESGEKRACSFQQSSIIHEAADSIRREHTDSTLKSILTSLTAA